MVVDLVEMLIQLGISENPSANDKVLAVRALEKATSAVYKYLKYDPEQKTHTEFYPQTDFTNSNSSFLWEVNDTEAYVRTTSTAATSELQLKHLPIRSITDLRIDYDGRNGTRSGAFGTGTIKTQGADYWPNFDGLDSQGNKLCRDGILRSQGLWPDQAGSVKVVYVAGYTQDELQGRDEVIDVSPICEAIMDEAVRRFLKIKSRSKNRMAGFVGPLTSETLGDYSWSSNSAIWGKLVGGESDLLSETKMKLEEFVRMDLGVM